MRKIFSVTSRQVRRLAMEYAESGEKKSFQQDVYKRQHLVLQRIHL